MKAHRRPVSGCGSQRMLHALERRSHPADHGSSFASLFPPLAAVSSAAIPVRVKLKIPRANAAAATTLDIPSRWDPRANQSPTGALVAVLRTAALFDSRTGQIKNPPSECSGSHHIRHSYRMGLTTTTTAASGRCREELLGQRPARRKCRPRHARMLGAATRGTKKEPTGLFFAACGRPCSFDSSYGLHEKIPDPKIRDFIHDPYGNRTHVTAVKGPCLNRLTNGP